MKKNLYWLPRLLSILFIIFISLFALDVIGQSGWFFGLLVHLIPSYFLTAFTVIAWKNEKVGGFLFLLAGFGLLILTRFEAFMVAIPAFIIGVLFLAISQIIFKQS